uniref:Serine/threonine-protein kinase RIO1 n=2 Tax=Auxenochlorella protothecoides TaxID=3075 RepID=A0A1D2A9U5_AUXPR
MQACGEDVSLDRLALRYGSDSDGENVTKQRDVKAIALPTPEAAERASPLPATSEAEDSEEEDSFDEDEELASALAWADIQDDHLARGHAGAGAASGAALASALHRPNAHGGALHRAARAQPAPTPGNSQHLGARFSAGAVDAAGLAARGLAGDAAARVRASKGGGPCGAARGSKDRADRATVEQVLDPRTRMVLFKMLNRGVFAEINGVVSTGKEANVYHATNPAGEELAIKVYKTSILVFKDRDRYVVGDSRFQRYCKSNPRKMVKMWAEKELRNLARLHAAGVRAPQPLQLRMHVLAMQFLGSGGVAAPRLRDAGLPPARMRQAYGEMVLLIRTMYQKCRLVHADLSEYNVLVHQNELWIIDVSQSVEPDHPRAFDFLREDCLHVNDYFRRQGVATLTVKELFDFAVDPAVTDDNLDDTMDALMQLAAGRPIDTSSAPDSSVADAVWAQAFIPKKLDEVANHERDHARLQAGEPVEGIYYQALAGMKADMSGARTLPLALEIAEEKVGERHDAASGSEAGSSSSSSGGSGDSSGSDAESGDEAGAGAGWTDGKPAQSKEEIRAARREHKKAVKESNQERRKKKLPKKEKARKLAKSKSKKK